MTIREENLAFFKKFISICKENNIWYSVVSGTLLGTIRNHGPIPWDDDYDVMMTLKSYDKLRKLFPGNCLDYKTNKKYPFLSNKFVPNLDDLYSKPVFVDLFIIFPSNELLLKRFSTIRNKFRNGISLFHSLLRFRNMTIFQKIFTILTWPIHFLIKKINYIEYYNKCVVENDDTKFYTLIYQPFNFKNKPHIKELSYKRNEWVFTDFKVQVIIEYKEMLISQYGEDYMTPVKWVGYIHTNVLEME